jgi:CheY-like chemotaxis protein
MNAILGFGQLLDTDTSLPLTTVQHGHVGEILRAGDKLLALINELLDLARIEAGELPLTLEPVDLTRLVHECLVVVDPAARQRGVKLVLPEQLAPDARVLADRLRLRQVLLNLLAHALQYTRWGGSVQIHFEPDGDAWCIVVRDAGAALDAQQRDRVLHAFERLGSDDEAIDGAGIGLALSKRLVALMRGDIGLDSAAGVGNRFWVRLARADVSPGGSAASGGTVLYIEDNAVNMLLMEAVLEQQTCLRMLSAPLPEVGLQMARDEHPDLILLDIQLPGIDGYEVLRRLRAASETRAIPVIAISANAMHADVQRGRAAGFDEYLTKPIDQRLLLAALSRLLKAPVARI